MVLSEKTRSSILNILGVMKILGGAILFVAVSWEVIYGGHIHFSGTYLNIQLAVCGFFLADFCIRWIVAAPRSQFLMRNTAILLISIPYLNLIAWSGLHLSHDWEMLVGLMPLARACFASFIIVRWMASSKINLLLASYVFTVVVFTYLAALVFYDYEVLVNPKLENFGNALWWAWMNVTTVGAEIFAVTTIGKIITVLLPTLGMMMFPIFTTYILDRYAGFKGMKKSDGK